MTSTPSISTRDKRPSTSAASSTSSTSGRRPAGSSELDPPAEGEIGDRPVEQPRIAEPVAKLACGRRPDAALAGRGRPVDRHDETPARVLGRSRLRRAGLVGPGVGSRIPGRPRATGPRRRSSGRTVPPQRPEADRPDPDADKAVDRSADGREHPSQLALPALAERRPVPDERGGGGSRTSSQEADLGPGHRPEVAQRRVTLVERDPGLEAAPAGPATAAPATPRAYSRSTP